MFIFFKRELKIYMHYAFSISNSISPTYGASGKDADLS